MRIIFLIINYQEKVLPPEQIQRLNVLLNPSYGGCLLDHTLTERVEFMHEKEMAELAHILRVHDINYIMKIMNACSQAVHFSFYSL